MGIDGTNCLEIHGSKEDLDMLQESSLVIRGNEDITEIAERFFGSKQIHVLKRRSTYLAIGYEFRNYPVYEYLRALLEAYPKCWMKNEFNSDGGYCGLWIAHMAGNDISVQEVEWEEPCIEEKCLGSDFSRP